MIFNQALESHFRSVVCTSFNCFDNINDCEHIGLSLALLEGTDHMTLELEFPVRGVLHI